MTESRAASVLPGSLPFETGDELAGHAKQVTEDVGKCLAGRLLHGEDLHLSRADHQMISVAIDRRVGDEVIQNRLRRGRRHGRRTAGRSSPTDGRTESVRGPSRDKPKSANCVSKDSAWCNSLSMASSSSVSSSFSE